MHRLWSDLGPIKKYCSPQFGFLIIFLLMGSSSLPRRFCWFLFWIVASSSQRVAEIKKFVVLRGRIGIVSYFLPHIRSYSYDQSLAFQQDLVLVMNSLFGYCPPIHPSFAIKKQLSFETCCYLSKFYKVFSCDISILISKSSLNFGVNINLR